jgi:protocatechuate 3,4-dioxygenase, beta subunit
MTTECLYSRRLVLGGGLLAAAGLAGAGRSQNLLSVTSGQDLGPFFPVVRPLDQDSDLAHLQGSGRAQGTVINVVGRVLDRNGSPVSGARLDIWQANAMGRYAHPGDQDTSGDRPLDPNFQGSATLVTAADGAFRFRTIKPGAYPIPGDLRRTPHIHFDVTGARERLTTQMYFPGEALNDTDFILRNAIPRESVIARAIEPLSDDRDHPAFHWDVVLAVG